MAGVALSRRALLARGKVAGVRETGSAQQATPPLMIGMLTDRAGLGASVCGPLLLQAVRKALEDTGSLPDKRPVSMVTEQFQPRPDDDLTIARRWFDQVLHAVAATKGLDPGLINREMRRSPVDFLGRPARRRLDGRRSIDLSLRQVKPPGAMRDDGDHYPAIGVISSGEIYPKLRETGCRFSL